MICQSHGFGPDLRVRKSAECKQLSGTKDNECGVKITAYWIEPCS